MAEDEPDLPVGPVVAPEVRVMARGGMTERERAAEILLGDDGGRPVLLNIRSQAMGQQRSAQWATLMAEIVGWKGTKEQVIAYIVQQLGVSVPEAREAVLQIERAPSDPHEIAAECRKYLAWYDGPEGPGGMNA